MKPFYCILLLLHGLAGLGQPPKSNTIFYDLDSAYKYKDSVRYLHLKRDRIEQGKLKYLQELPHLTALWLESGYLSEIPDEIYGLRQLRELNISWIKIAKIPEEIARLENLQHLEISSTPVEDIPDWLYGMKQLRTLRLPNNKIVRIQNNIPPNSTLEYLDLSTNQLTELPASLSRLNNLKRLNLQSNQFSELPGIVISLPQLEKLELENNQLTQLPDLTPMAKLKTLFISRNPVPVSGISLLPPSLQSFYGYDTDFSEIPVSLQNCKHLQNLIITKGTITSIPDWVGSLDSLRWLNLEKNSITQIPASLAQLPVLEKLVLSQNHIDSIPPGLFGMPSLLELSINNNPVHHIPPTLLLSKSLRRLNIENTLIPQNEYKQYRRELAQQPVIITANDKKSRREEWSNRQGPCYQEDEIFDYEVFIKTEVAPSFHGNFSSFFNRGLPQNETLPGPGTPDTVVLRFIVKPGGGITRITILKFSKQETLHEAVNITQLSCAYWKPGIIGGRELLSWCTLQFIFTKYDNKSQPARYELTATQLSQGNRQ